MIVPEDNTVSDDEMFVENQEDSVGDASILPSQDDIAEEVIVADVDGPPVMNNRPRRKMQERDLKGYNCTSMVRVIKLSKNITLPQMVYKKDKVKMVMT